MTHTHTHIHKQTNSNFIDIDSISKMGVCVLDGEEIKEQSGTIVIGEYFAKKLFFPCGKEK